MTRLEKPTRPHLQRKYRLRRRRRRRRFHTLKGSWRRPWRRNPRGILAHTQNNPFERTDAQHDVSRCMPSLTQRLNGAVVKAVGPDPVGAGKALRVREVRVITCARAVKLFFTILCGHSVRIPDMEKSREVKRHYCPRLLLPGLTMQAWQESGQRARSST